MNDTEKLLIENYLETLRQLQRFLVLGLATSVSAAALAFQKLGKESVSVGFVLVPLDATTARDVLFGLCLLAGVMATFYAETANNIAAYLRGRCHELLLSASTFPSLGTLPYRGSRYIAALLPVLFASISRIRPALQEKPIPWQPTVGTIVFAIICYVFLVPELHALPCVNPRLSKADSSEALTAPVGDSKNT